MSKNLCAHNKKCLNINKSKFLHFREQEEAGNGGVVRSAAKWGRFMCMRVCAANETENEAMLVGGAASTCHGSWRSVTVKRCMQQVWVLAWREAVSGKRKVQLHKQVTCATCEAQRVATRKEVKQVENFGGSTFRRLCGARFCFTCVVVAYFTPCGNAGKLAS